MANNDITDTDIGCETGEGNCNDDDECKQPGRKCGNPGEGIPDDWPVDSRVCMDLPKCDHTHALEGFHSGKYVSMCDFHNFGLIFAGQMHCLPQRQHCLNFFQTEDSTWSVENFFKQH